MFPLPLWERSAAPLRKDVSHDRIHFAGHSPPVRAAEHHPDARGPHRRDHHWGASGALRHHGGGAHGPGHVRHEPDQRPDHARRDIRWGHLWRRELGHSHLHAGHAFLRGDHVRRLAAVPEGEGGSRAVHVASVLGLRGHCGHAVPALPWRLAGAVRAPVRRAGKFLAVSLRALHHRGDDPGQHGQRHRFRRGGHLGFHHRARPQHRRAALHLRDL